MNGIDTNTITAVGGIASAIFAGLALIYNAIQTSAAKGSYLEAAKQSKIAAEAYAQSARTYYYQILKDFSDQIDDVQGSEKRNNDHRSFATKYLNIFDRLIFLVNKGVIQKNDVIMYFENDLKAAKGLLEMKEYTSYVKRYKDFNDWCQKANIEADPPLLPYPDIRIKNGSFDPDPQDARVGDFVTWVSDDTEKHRIMSGKNQDDHTKGQEFDSGTSGVLALTKEGRCFSHEFNTAGIYDYFCDKHPNKEVGKLKVKG